MLPERVNLYKWVLLSLFLLLLLFANVLEIPLLEYGKIPNNPQLEKQYVADQKQGVIQHDPALDQTISSQDGVRHDLDALPDIEQDVPAMTIGNIAEMVLSDLSRFKEVEVIATGYYAGIESTGKMPGHPQYGITYSGVKVRRSAQAISTIAADPAIFPLGTLIYVPGYGLGVVADTGGAIKGHKIDLYFDTKEQVYKEWGKKTVNVYVITTGNGVVTEAMLDQPDEWIVDI